jgi:hypothetical protein
MAKNKKINVQGLQTLNTLAFRQMQSLLSSNSLNKLK